MAVQLRLHVRHCRRSEWVQFEAGPQEKPGRIACEPEHDEPCKEIGHVPHSVGEAELALRATHRSSN